MADQIQKHTFAIGPSPRQVDWEDIPQATREKIVAEMQRRIVNQLLYGVSTLPTGRGNRYSTTPDPLKNFGSVLSVKYATID